MIDFQKVADTIEKSSDDIKNLMFSPELADKLYDIAETSKLSENEAFNLVDEVGYVILGLKQRFTFSESLEKIGFDSDQAKSISEKIERGIFFELDKIKNVERNDTIDKKQWFYKLPEDQKS